ncbi:MAG TPA: hypothetical protein VGK84_13180 [Candidatus Tumulicola sp.]|jgi:hypothetical protein
MVATLLLVVLAGCGAGASSLPYHSMGIDDSTGMTVEQYALGRLSASHAVAACMKRAHTASAAVATKLCSRK